MSGSNCDFTGVLTDRGFLVAYISSSSANFFLNRAVMASVLKLYSLTLRLGGTLAVQIGVGPEHGHFGYQPSE